MALLADRWTTLRRDRDLAVTLAGAGLLPAGHLAAWQVLTYNPEGVEAPGVLVPPPGLSRVWPCSTCPGSRC